MVMWMLRRCVCIWLYSEDFWSAACNRGISQTRFEISLCSTLFAERCWDLFNPFSSGRVRRIGSTLTSTCGSCQVGIPALKHGTVSKVFESFANASEGLREVTQNGKKGMTHVNELKQGSNYWMLKCSKCCVYCWGQWSHTTQNDSVPVFSTCVHVSPLCIFGQFGLRSLSLAMIV